MSGTDERSDPMRARRRWLGLVGSLALLRIPVARSADAAIAATADRKLFPPDAWELVAAHRARLIDVRTSAERTTGSPRGVSAEIVYPMDGHGDDAFVAAVSSQVQGDRAAPLILICAGGPRSEAAQHLLRSRGFSNVRTVINGFQGWLDLDMPRAR